MFFFFFQAEDGIRDIGVTGVQTCALPIFNYTDFMLQHFWDEKEGNLFFTSDDHEQLISRTKNFYDLAMPSGNSMAASNLLRLHYYTHNDSYLAKAVRIMKAGSKSAAENPFGFGQMLNSIYLYVKKPVEVTVIAKIGRAHV